jgi:hypothetical protein
LGRTPHLTERLDCFETLLLMGKIDRVPPETLDAWFQQRVVVLFSRMSEAWMTCGSIFSALRN